MAAEKKNKLEDITRPLTKPRGVSEFGPTFPEKDTISPGDAAALLDAVAAISAPLEVHQVAEEVARQIVRFSKVDICAVSRWDEEEDRISLWAEYQRGQENPSPIPYLSYRASDYPVTLNVLTSAEPVHMRMDDPTL
ncbi:MAG: hypothetical protein P8Z30_09595, partial [Acidobacteriota bacterium]